MVSKNTYDSQVNPSMLEEALQYWELGWSIIPLHPPRFYRFPKLTEKQIEGEGKIPATDWKRYQDERLSQDSIRDYWNRKNYNIAIITGQISGIYVVDLDGGDVYRAYVARYGQPYCPFARTGNGYHAYFQYPKGYVIRNIAGSLKDIDPRFERLDGRGEGGYVVAPPSIHRSGRWYEWIKSPSAFKELPPLPKQFLADLIEREKAWPIGSKPEQKQKKATAYSQSQPIINISEQDKVVAKMILRQPKIQRTYRRANLNDRSASDWAFGRELIKEGRQDREILLFLMSKYSRKYQDTNRWSYVECLVDDLILDAL